MQKLKRDLKYYERNKKFLEGQRKLYELDKKISKKLLNTKQIDTNVKWVPLYDEIPYKQIYIRRKPYWYVEPELCNLGYLYYFKRHSNIYVVITNYLKKHLYTVTAGNALLGKKKKEKLAVHNLIKLIKKVCSLLRYYKINNVEIRWKQRLTRHFYTIYHSIRKRRIFVRAYRFMLYKAHGRMKKRKMRRV